MLNSALPKPALATTAVATAGKCLLKMPCYCLWRTQTIGRACPPHTARLNSDIRCESHGCVLLVSSRQARVGISMSEVGVSSRNRSTMHTSVTPRCKNVRGSKTSSSMNGIVGSHSRSVRRVGRFRATILSARISRRNGIKYPCCIQDQIGWPQPQGHGKEGQIQIGLALSATAV